MSEKKHSTFLKVKCEDCDSEQTVFNKSNLQINCSVCGSTLVNPTGGTAEVKGKVVGALENAPEK